MWPRSAISPGHRSQAFYGHVLCGLRELTSCDTATAAAWGGQESWRLLTLLWLGRCVERAGLSHLSVPDVIQSLVGGASAPIWADGGLTATWWGQDSGLLPSPAEVWLSHGRGGVQGTRLPSMVAACLLTGRVAQVLTEPSCCLTPAPEGIWGCSPTPVAVWSLHMVEGLRWLTWPNCDLGTCNSGWVTEGSLSLAIARVGTAHPPV